jgi:beta-galactosidase
MNSRRFLSLSLALLCVSHLIAADEAARERLSFDPGWQFQLGDIPVPAPKGLGKTYWFVKTGNADGGAAMGLDDSAWRTLDLPHDWAIEGPVDKNANLDQGCRPRGIAWYRKRFTLPESDRSKNLELAFDGIATHATVWINGIPVHRNWGGYTGLTIDLTPYARFGGKDNIVAVRVDAEAMEGWWYEGAGMYRHTWLTKRAPVHIATDGVFAHPVRDAQGAWTIPVAVTIGNTGESATDATVESVLVDPDGHEVARGSATVSAGAFDQGVARFALAVSSPRLWSPDQPTLYRVRTALTAKDGSRDAVETTCGFRTIRFDADQGFILNDQPLKIKGTCNHQDHAGVGTAIPDALWTYRVRRLKELGSNAVRCSHNPPAPEFLAECDRQGLLVMDETRTFNSAPEYLGQLEWMVRRDRNHPSVILWSIANEEPMQNTEQGCAMAKRMKAAVRRLDTDRPVTAAMSGGMFDPANISQVLDVMGFNYLHKDYDRFHKAHPTQPMTSTEDCSAYMIRGEYTTDTKAHRLGSYDDQPSQWGATHRVSWKAIAERPFMAGCFVWTGFDYHGEPQPFEWPSVNSFLGIMDICGLPKAAYYLRQAQWIDNKPVLKIVPHWNWAGQEGKDIKVMVHSNAERVALFLNGQALGEQVADRYDMNTWMVKYAPGRLEAVAYRAGKEIARDVVETTGAPAALRLVPDRTALKGDGQDAMPITVEVVDAQGRVVPTASPMATFTIAKGADIIGLGNGDPNGHEPEKGDHHSLFYGLGQVIVRSQAGATGTVQLIASAEGLAPGHIDLALTAAPAPAAVPGNRPVLEITKWRMSHVSSIRPDPARKVDPKDQNSWVAISNDKPLPFATGTWAVQCAVFKPFAAQRAAGGVISFASIVGKAEVWIDGHKAAEKTTAEAAPLTAPFPAGNGEHAINVLIEVAQAGASGGLAGRVMVEATPR